MKNKEIIKYHRFPMNIEMPGFKDKIRPDNKMLVRYSKKAGVEIVETDAIDQNTYIVFDVPAYLPHDFIMKIIGLYANQYHQYRKIVNVGEFFTIMDKASDFQND